MGEHDTRKLRILLRLPNWLGDSVMASVAFERLKAHFPNATFSLVGTAVTCGIYERDSRVERIFIDKTKDSKNRLLATLRFAKIIGRHDISITFNNHFFAALLLFATKTPIRIGYGRNLRSFLLTKRPRFVRQIHQVVSYTNLINELCGGKIMLDNALEMGELRLISRQIPHFRKDYEKRYIGINAGAAFGSAKRWEERYFAEIIWYFLQNDCVVLLFGSKGDNLRNLEHLIAAYPKAYNLINLIGETTICDLCDYMAVLDLLITNDSGPMHIAAAYQIPIIAIFGATDSRATSPWRANAILLDKHLPCAPCQKRICPLGHHNCMKLITPDEVIENANALLMRRV